jgi:hypothetical protein
MNLAGSSFHGVFRLLNTALIESPRNIYFSITHTKLSLGSSKDEIDCIPVRFRLCMSMEWKNECVDRLFITQLLKA